MAIICGALTLYLLVIFARIILSWVPVSSDGVMASVDAFVRSVTEPVMGPLRSMLPPVRLGGAALDLSPMVLIFGITILQRVICS
ncbi:MAG: YggT family protein [Acidimicrobiia bacterium]